MKTARMLGVLMALGLAGLCGAVDFDTTHNPLANGGGEQGWLGDWVLANGFSLVMDAGAASGDYSFEAAGTGAELGHTVVQVVAGETMQIKAMYRTMTGVVDNGSNVQLRYYADDNSYLGGTVANLATTNGAWVEFAAEGVVPAGAVKADVYIYIDATGTVRIDDVAVHYEDKYDLDQNILFNGDASYGTFSNWVYISNVVIDPNGAFLMNGATSGLSHHYQSCPAEQTLLVSLDYRTPKGFSGTDSVLYVRFWDSKGTYYSQTFMALKPTNYVWENLSMVVQSPAAAGLVDIFVDGKVDQANFDNVAVYLEKAVFDPREQYIENGDFELGDTSSMSYVENMAVVDTDNTTPGGMYCVEGSTSPRKLVPYAVYDLVPGEKLRITFDYQTSVGATQNKDAARFWVRFYGEDMNGDGYLDWLPGQPLQALPLTNGAWQTVTQTVACSPLAVAMDLYWSIGETAVFTGTAKLDSIEVYRELFTTDAVDLADFTGQWLSDTRDAPGPDLVLDDFEAYNGSPTLADFWANSSGSYAITGTSSDLSLLTSGAHGGSQALRWMYNNVDADGQGAESWVEFHKALPMPIDASTYDELHVWVNRAVGNSEERQFYVKFYNGSIDPNSIVAQSTGIGHADGSSYSPTGWTEWVIDLNTEMEFLNGAASMADLDEVVGFFFGVVGDATNGQGSGTIDFDDIVLVDSVPNCLTPSTWDYSGDCILNFEDYAEFAYRWFANW